VVFFRKETKPLKYRAISEPVTVGGKFEIISVGALQIGAQAVRDLLNAPAEGWIIEHVDDRAMNVGYRNFGLMAPDRFCAKYLVGVEMLERKLETLPCLGFPAHGLSCDNYHVLEYLFGKVPMFRRCPPGYVGG